MSFLDPKNDPPAERGVVEALQRAAEAAATCTPEEYLELLKLSESSTEDLRKRTFVMREPFRLTE